MEYAENNPNCSLYQVPPTLKILWKSVKPFFRNVANKQADKQTNPENGQRWKHNLRHGGGNKMKLSCTLNITIGLPTNYLTALAYTSYSYMGASNGGCMRLNLIELAIITRHSFVTMILRYGYPRVHYTQIKYIHTKGPFEKRTDFNPA